MNKIDENLQGIEHDKKIDDPNNVDTSSPEGID